ncbi:MAG: glutathione S-transferase family protein [Gammaproteobacteria bacterium]|nr:glutathione S-transferase family protein [Gammaproteobacteria bacterium]
MGLLVDGKWQDKWYDTESTGGKFKRQTSSFRQWISADDETFVPAANRYHLYVSLACPWAHRTLIMRKLKGLESLISVSVVNPYMLEHGWTFAPHQGVIPDPIFNADYLYQIYLHAQSDYTGRVTVPVLFDKQTQQLVNNESADIMRMLNSAFNDFATSDYDFYPQSQRPAIDDLNQFIYNKINNGVYKAGFATKQEVYEAAVDELFDALTELDVRLGKQRYLLGAKITETDWRLFTTLIRFDPVYVGHFKCNLKRITDFKNLSGYLKDLYQIPGIAETVNMHHIKHHYYGSHKTINPTLIVPKGPTLDLQSAHLRERLS